jgi:hypothetical protein
MKTTVYNAAFYQEVDIDLSFFGQYVNNPYLLTKVHKGVHPFP